MGLISTIQKHSYILVGLIGLALISFLVMDINSNMGLLNQAMNNVVKVNGDALTVEEYDKKYKELEEEIVRSKQGKALTEQEQEQIKNEIWTNFVNNEVVGTSLDKLGLEVTKSELAEMTMGQYVDKNIAQIPAFHNAQGAFDPMLVKAYLNTLGQDDPGVAPGTKKKQWLVFEKNIKDARRLTKFNVLISSALYVPNWYYALSQKNYSAKADIEYVYVPYSSINDKDVEVTDSKLNSYFKENIKRFTAANDVVSVSYASFPIQPTPQDSLNIVAEFDKKVEMMKTETNDTNFFRSYGDNNFDTKYYRQEELLDKVPNAPVLMSAASGSVVGPHMYNKNYQAIKIISKKNIADSVKVREIAISFADLVQAQNQAGIQQRLKLVDSLFKELDTLHADFNVLAAQHSTDKGQNPAHWISMRENKWPMDVFYQGGSQKYFKAINDREGVVRILKVEEFPANIPAVQIGIISEAYAPSDATQNQIFQSATNYRSSVKSLNDFTKNIAKYPTAKFEQGYLNQGQFELQSFPGNARELVRWAFNSKTDDISSIMSVGDHYVIAYNRGLVSRTNPDLAPVKEDVKKTYVYEQKRKMLAEKLNKSKSLQDAATANKVSVARADSVSYQNAAFAGSPEPAAVCYAAFSKLNVVSPAIVGTNGAFKIKTLSQSSTPMAPEMMLNFQQQLQQQFKSVDGITEGMIENAKIKDNRVNIY